MILDFARAHLELVGLALGRSELVLQAAVLLGRYRQNVRLILDHVSQLRRIVHISQAVQIVQKVAMSTHLSK